MNIIYLHGLSSNGNSNAVKQLSKLHPDDNIVAPDIPVNLREALF